MRTLYAALILFALCATAFSGAVAQHNKMGPHANILYHELGGLPAETLSKAPRLIAAQKAATWLSDYEASEKPHFHYPLQKRKGVVCARAIIKVTPGFTPEDLAAAGAEVRTQMGDIWTIFAPLNQFVYLAQLDGVAFIELEKKMGLESMETARARTFVDEVHMGVDLPEGYDGHGVLLGVFDSGYDYQHPAFFDVDGNLRVKRVWQYKDDSGAPPANFDYGTEYDTPESIEALQSDRNEGSHGMHVANIAAGSSRLQYGVAPGADLALVSDGYLEGYNMRDSVDIWNGHLMDGAKYISDLALETGQPAVVNMSVGTLLGTQDGTSLVDQAMANISSERNGIILVTSAGNSSRYNTHVDYTLTSDVDSARALVYTEGGRPMFLTAISEPGGKVGLRMMIVDSSEREPFAFTDLFYSDKDTTINGLIVIENDTLDYTVVSYTSYPTNGKPAVFISYYHEEDFPYMIGTSIRGAQGSPFHFWNVGRMQGYPLWPSQGWTPGNNRYSIGEPATSPGVISVGAYTSTKIYTNLAGETQEADGVLGRIAPFSSLGPTADDRIKPDITAPGNTICSAVSRADTVIMGSRSERLCDFLVSENDTFYYASYEGTSMSGPVCAGVVALMLQANPQLNQEQARDILRQTANTEGIGEQIDPDEGSITWGWGKVDAHAAVTEALRVASRSDLRGNAELFYNVYPNPASDELHIRAKLPETRIQRISITDLSGKTVAEQHYGPTPLKETSLDVSSLAQGVYLLRIFDNEGVSAQKIILN